MIVVDHNSTYAGLGYYDVIVVPNMFGDIITDLGAMIQGGMGIAAGGNINPNGTSNGKVWKFTTESYKGVRCFSADTLVWLEGSLTQISEIIPGQELPTFEAASAQLPQPQVESIDEHEGIFSECYDIILKTCPERSRRGGNRITVVDSHFFLTASGQWTRVQDLRAGCQLQSLTGPIAIKNIVRRPAPYIGKAYNLKITNCDRYCVGEDAVVVRDH